MKDKSLDDLRKEAEIACSDPAASAHIEKMRKAGLSEDEINGNVKQLSIEEFSERADRCINGFNLK